MTKIKLLKKEIENYSFLRQNGLEILASKQAIEEAIERGHARRDEAIVVVYDDSMR